TQLNRTLCTAEPASGASTPRAVNVIVEHSANAHQDNSRGAHDPARQRTAPTSSPCRARSSCRDLPVPVRRRTRSVGHDAPPRGRGDRVGPALAPPRLTQSLPPPCRPRAYPPALGSRRSGGAGPPPFVFSPSPSPSPRRPGGGGAPRARGNRGGGRPPRH